MTHHDGGPVTLRVTSDRILTSPEVLKLVDETRAAADAFVFLSGGASRMAADVRRRIADLLGALTLLSDRDVRIAVGDGGTRTGIMEAAGAARRASRRPFPLIGVAPFPELKIPGSDGRHALDPNHGYAIVVENPAWVAAKRSRGGRPGQPYWGSETAAMYAFFGRLSEGRPSVTIVANGGVIALDEIRENIAAERMMVLVAGSGRVADALVDSLAGTAPSGGVARRLRMRIDDLGLTKRRDLYCVFELSKGASELAALLEKLLSRK